MMDTLRSAPYIKLRAPDTKLTHPWLLPWSLSHIAQANILKWTPKTGKMMGGEGKEDKMSRESAGVSWLLGGSRSVLRLGGDLRVERLPCPPESRPSRLCLWYFSKPWETLKAFYLGVDTLQTGEGYLQGGRHINRGLTRLTEKMGIRGWMQSWLRIARKNWLCTSLPKSTFSDVTVVACNYSHDGNISKCYKSDKLPTRIQDC